MANLRNKVLNEDDQIFQLLKKYISSPKEREKEAYQLGKIYLDKKNYVLSICYLTEANRTTINLTYLKALSDAYCACGQRIEEAIEHYQNALLQLSHIADKAECNFQIGLLYLHQKKVNEAIFYFGIAKKQFDDPNQKAKCYYQRGMIKQNLKIYGGAFKSFKKAVHLFSSDDDRANCYFKMGLLEKKESAMEESFLHALRLFDAKNPNREICLLQYHKMLEARNKKISELELKLSGVAIPPTKKSLAKKGWLPHLFKRGSLLEKSVKSEDKLSKMTYCGSSYNK